jgi:outer membrane biosynthesis protein TonB
MRLYSSIAAIGWIMSVGLHVGGVAMLLVSPDRARAAPRRTLVTFSVVSQPETVQLSQPRLPPLPTQAVKPTQRIGPVAAPRAPVEKPLTSRVPVDLTGVTLTSRDGSDWSSITGNGLAIDAPTQPTVVATHQPPISKAYANTGPSAKAQTQPPLVPLRELTIKPTPPELDRKLAENYPPTAKRQGLAGKARVLARVDADGTVRQTSVIFESSAGFGTACRQTLLGSKWSPPRDRTGRAVATQIYYSCDFRADG